MSESSRTTIDDRAAETLNVEDLFATDDTDISIDDGAADAAEPGTQTTTAPAEDTTAGELFAQLREDHTDAEPGDDTVGEESPEDIMARAGEETQHVDQIDDAIRADEGALDDLLLTERREADGFRWVETEDDGNDRDERVSLFESGDDETNDDAADDRAAHDDFSLDTTLDSSFEARAATFEGSGGASHVDENDVGTPPDADSESTGGGNAGEPTDDAVSTHSMDATRTESTTETPKSDDSDGDSAGLASRIRSILSG